MSKHDGMFNEYDDDDNEIGDDDFLESESYRMPVADHSYSFRNNFSNKRTQAASGKTRLSGGDGRDSASQQRDRLRSQSQSYFPDENDSSSGLEKLQGKEKEEEDLFCQWMGKNLSKLLQAMEQMNSYIQEPDLSRKVVEVFFQSHRLLPLSRLFTAEGRGLPSTSTAMKRKKKICEHIVSLDRAFQTLASSSLDVLDRFKEGYLQQVKRMQETATNVTRNALQMERRNALNQLSANETKHQKAVAVLQGQYSASMETINVLKERIASLEKENSQLEQRLRQQDQVQDEERRRTIDQQVDRYRLDYQQRIGEMKVEKKEALDGLERRYERRIEELQKMEEDKWRRHYQGEARLREEIDSLKNELQQRQDEVLQERYRQSERMEEVKASYEVQLQHRAAEVSKAVATIREDHQKVVQHFEEERRRLLVDQEEKLKAVRQQRDSQHLYEMEAMKERLLADHRRRQTELEVHYQEQIQKIKALHEQELGRHIRESDRLRRLLQSNANVNTTQPPPPPPPPPPPLSQASSSSSANPSSAPVGAGSLGGTVKAQFVPSSRNQSTNPYPYASSSSTLRRTANSSPSPPPPPDNLLLEEATFTAEKAVRSMENDGKSSRISPPTSFPSAVGGNSRRVSAYLSELERYLSKEYVAPLAKNDSFGKVGRDKESSSAARRRDHEVEKDEEEDAYFFDLSPASHSSSPHLINNPSLQENTYLNDSSENTLPSSLFDLAAMADGGTGELELYG